MERHVFKGNVLGLIIVNFAIVTVVIVIGFTTFKTPVVFLLWLITLFTAIRVAKNKLTIEDGILRFDRMFNSKEIALTDVSEIVLYEDPNSDGQEKRYMYVVDQTGKTFFRFPISYISKNNDHIRFKKAVIAASPETKVSYESNIININRLFQDYQEYRKNKKDEKDA